MAIALLPASFGAVVVVVVGVGVLFGFLVVMVAFSVVIAFFLVVVVFFVLVFTVDGIFPAFSAFPFFLF